MRKRLIPVAVSLCLCLLCHIVYCQDTNVFDKVINLPSSYFDKLQNKYSHFNHQLSFKTEKYLKRLARNENKLKRKLYKIDSAKAENLFGNIDKNYRNVASNFSSDSISGNYAKGEYIPHVDSVKTSLRFLQQESQLLANAKDIKQKIKNSLNSVNQLQSKFQQSEQVKAFIAERKQQIKEAFSQYTNLPNGIRNSLADFNKQAYYYGQQVQNYKDMLKEPDRMIEKGLSLLNKLPAFKQFMQQHSELASLFRLPDNYGTPQSLAGLQTRALVTQQIQTQLASAGPNAQQYLQQNLQAAQAQLNQLKDKIIKHGGSTDDMSMPNFKPNNQKTKSFWQRLEYGTNLQTVRANFFPTTTDFGLSVGYKINDKSIIGVGASYKMGWGKDIRNISISHQGAGLRSFLDMKIKGSFFATGGYEYNYQPSSITNPTNGAGNITAWQQSGLLGLTKVVSIKSRFFKKTRLQLLWDFLSYQQVPRTQQVKFRVGYNF